MQSKLFANIPKLVKSTSYDQEEIIEDILRLHSESGVIDLDPTYSKGVFYKGDIQAPQYKFDVNPVIPGVEKACATSLPLPDECVSTIMFDPPFLATKGPSLVSDGKDNNIINKRFGVFPTEQLLHDFYQNALKEMFRVCKHGGILIFKCQDKVSARKQYFSHCYVYEQARLAGWYAKDMFVLVAKTRIVADWQKKHQQHARKFHSYFWVFKKSNTVVCI